MEEASTEVDTGYIGRDVIDKFAISKGTTGA